MRNHWLSLHKTSSPPERLKMKGAASCLDIALNEREVLGTCFSEQRDLLSQWRGYADDGAGFSVTFDRPRLEEWIRNEQKALDLDLVKVSYGNHDYEAVTEVIKKLAAAFSEDAKRYSEGNGIGTISLDFGPTGQKHKVYADAAKSLFTVKNGAFREEKEWRIMKFGPLEAFEELKFRVSRNAISPYVSVPIPSEAIIGVTIGPTNRTPEHIVKEVLRRNLISNAQVRTSSASYTNR